MSQLHNIDIGKIADNSKLIVPDSEYEAVERKLSSVLKWIDEIQAINTDDVETLVNIVSDSSGYFYGNDKTKIGLKMDDMQIDNKHNDGEYFLVPKVIE